MGRLVDPETVIPNSKTCEIATEMVKILNESGAKGMAARENVCFLVLMMACGHYGFKNVREALGCK